MFNNVGNMLISDSTITMLNNQTTTNFFQAPHAVAEPKQHIPSKPAIFHGRDSSVEEISQLLCNEATPRVSILGPGGMGKTSLALAIVESPAVQSKYGSRCYWIPCANASSSALLLQLLYTQVCFARTAPTNDILSDILAELKHVEEPTLLLLDNFETPCFPSQGTTQAVDDILFQLHKCSRVAILLTMRLLGKTKGPCNRIKWHTRHLQPVSKEASRLIFHDVYPDSKEDPDVDTLIAAVGHMPYAVVLMAKSGETCDFTAKALLEEWKQAGTTMISHSGFPEENMNRSISLSVNRDFVKQNPDALLLLQTLALLPVGTSMDNLRQWAPNIKSLSSAICSLSSAALLLQSEGHPMTPKILSILPVVQSFMHTTGQIPEEVRQNAQKACYQFILNHISQCEAHPRDRESIVIAEDRNVRLILLNSEPISLDLHLKYLLYFSHASRHWQNTDISEQGLSLARKLGDQKMIAQVLFALALVHGRKNAYDIAERYFSESYDLLGKFTDPESTQNTLECGLLLANCRHLLHQPPQVIIEFLQTIPLTPGDDFQRSLVKRNIGGCLRINGQFPEALHTLQEAKDLFMKTGHLDKVAATLSLISDAYYLSSQVEKCLASISEAREVAKSSGMTKTVIAFFDFKHGWFLFLLQRDMEALPIFQECLSIFESGGQLSTVVDCFMHMGSIHARQGNRDDACVAFESAIAKCTELGDTVEGRDKIMLLERLKEQVVGDSRVTNSA